MALNSRLFRICEKRSGSPMAWKSDPRSSSSTGKPLRIATAWAAATQERTCCQTLNLLVSRLNFESRMRARSRMSSVSRRS